MPTRCHANAAPDITRLEGPVRLLPGGFTSLPAQRRGAPGVTQTCCPRPGGPVTVTVLSRRVLHPRVPVGSPGLQSFPRGGARAGDTPNAPSLCRSAQRWLCSPPALRIWEPDPGEGGKAPPGPRRAGAGSVTQCTAGELGHGGGGGSDSVLPVPSRHRWAFGCWTAPRGSRSRPGCSKDADQHQEVLWDFLCVRKRVSTRRQEKRVPLCSITITAISR